MQIIENYEIKNDSTFRIGGTIKKVALPDTIEELIEILKSDEYELILGNCSNVLFSSNLINKNIIITKNVSNYRIEGTTVYVSAGTRGPIVAKDCQKLGLTGFEFLVGFPGSFGGMIYMNASAHNQAIADTFVSARIFNLKTKEIETFSKEDMKFEYRKSSISNGTYIVLDAIFELKQGNQEQIDEIIKRNIEFRKNRQPSLKQGNAGSTFKNPENDSAGRLLDLCEFKGVKEGGAMVFENHANFVVNYDNATSMDVLTLMFKMYSKVKEKYRIILEPEIKYIGDKGTQEYKLWELMKQENTKMIQK